MKLELAKKFKTGGAMSFLFKPAEQFIFKPGQFLRYHINNSTPDERGENRFFSIASAPFEEIIRITTKINKERGSTFKKDLQNLQIGDFIDGFGPSGSFTLEDPEKGYVFIAGGIGITPFRSILLDLDHRKKPINITLLYGNSTKDILFKDELEILEKTHPEFKIYYVISEKSVQNQPLSENIKTIPGKIDEVILKSLILNHQSLIYYVSGPEQMVIDVSDMLIKLGVPKENIKLDEFPGYSGY